MLKIVSDKSKSTDKSTECITWARNVQSCIFDESNKSKAYKRLAFPTLRCELTCNWTLAFDQRMLYKAVDCMLSAL